MATQGLQTYKKAHIKKVQDQLVSVGFLIACGRGLLASKQYHTLIVSCRWGYGIIDVIKLELIFRDMPIVKKPCRTLVINTASGSPI
jgi:hypothetical protein